MSNVMPKCPNHLNRNVTARGVCAQCYDMLARRVQRNRATWAELEEQGVVKPAGPRGRPMKELKPV